jgi:ComF family protein
MVAPIGKPLVAARLLAWALPAHCVLCGRPCGRASRTFNSEASNGLRALCGKMSQDPFCTACDLAYWNEARLRCVTCALPLAAGHAGAATSRQYRCAGCVGATRAFDATVALADYRPPLDRLTLDLKFRSRLALAEAFAERLARAARDAIDPGERPDVVVPVPLARKRLAARGFNQAWEIARRLARRLELPADATLLARVTETARQATLDADARRRNVEAAFAVTKPVRGLALAVVDDVMTSGATLEAAAQALKAAGARRVTNLVVLRTPKD